MNEYETVSSDNAEKYDEVDYKVIKKVYPRTNNSSVLEFVFGRDCSAYLRKNKILIFGSILVDNSYIPDTAFASKLFSMLTVEINSQVISTNRSK